MERSCCFTGHRPDKLPKSKNELEKLEQKIKEVVLKLIAEGYAEFYTGMAQGTDLLCGKVIADLRKENQSINLISVIPHAEHGKLLYGKSKEEYDYVLNNSTNYKIISPIYTSACMHQRNKFMVDNSDCVIAVYSGEKGGTKNTVDYAMKKGKRILRIYPATLKLKKTESAYQIGFKLD